MKLPHEILNDEFSKLPIDVKRWLNCIWIELKAAQTKFPKNPDNPIIKAAIVNEEAGELIRETLRYVYEKGRYYDMHQEAIQTAAMCLRFLLEMPEIPFPDDDE